MPIEFIGMIGTELGSETVRSAGPVIDPGLHQALRPRARGRRLRPDPDRLRPPAIPRARRSRPTPAAHTERISLLIAHRPGVRRPDPRRAARSPPSTSSAAAGWRVHTITGGNNARAAPRRRLPGEGRALRAHRRVPGHPAADLGVRGAVQPRGEHYKFEDHFAETSPPQPDPALLRRLLRGGLPGRRQARGHLRALGRAAEGDRRADRRRARGRARRRTHRAAGDLPAPSARSSRPTDELAWERAACILGAITDGSGFFSTPAAGPGSVRQAAGERRLPAAACRRRRADLHDRALWTAGRPRDRRGPGTPPPWSARPRRSPRPCSTTSTSASRTLRIRGYDPFDDAIDYGRLPAATRPRGSRQALTRKGGGAGRRPGRKSA